MQEQSPMAMYPEVGGNREMATLDYKVRELEMRFVNLEARIPNSKIVSPKFWSRALAVFGHQLSIVLIVNAVIFVLALVVLFLIPVISMIGR